MTTQTITVEFCTYLSIRLFDVLFLHLFGYSVRLIPVSFCPKSGLRKKLLCQEEHLKTVSLQRIIQISKNAKRRDRYHKLGSLDENISNEGRQTDRYDLIASDSLDAEQAYIYNELLGTVHDYISALSTNDQIIMVGKLRDRPISSSALSKIVECSDKTVTSRFKKHQEVLQDMLKDYR